MTNKRSFRHVLSLTIVCMFSLQALSGSSPNHVTITVYKESLDAMPEFEFSGSGKDAFSSLSKERRQEVLSEVVRKAAAAAPYSQKVLAGIIGAKKVLIGVTVAAGLMLLAAEVHAKKHGISLDQANHEIESLFLRCLALGGLATYIFNPRLAHEAAMWVAISNMAWLVDTLSSWHGTYTATYDLDSGKLVS